MAESVIGLFETEVSTFLGPWKSVGQVAWETVQRVSRYNTERLHGAKARLRFQLNTRKNLPSDVLA